MQKGSQFEGRSKHLPTLRSQINKSPTAPDTILFLRDRNLLDQVSLFHKGWKKCFDLNQAMLEDWPDVEGKVRLPRRPAMPENEADITQDHRDTLRNWEEETKHLIKANCDLYASEVKDRPKLYNLLIGQLDDNVIEALRWTTTGRDALEDQDGLKLIKALRLFLIGDGTLKDTAEMWATAKTTIEQLRMYNSETLTVFANRCKASMASAVMAADAHRATLLEEHAEEVAEAEAYGGDAPPEPSLVQTETMPEYVKRFLNCINIENSTAFKSSMESNAVLEFKNKALNRNLEGRMFFRMNCATIDDVVTNLQRAMAERRERPEAYDMRPNGRGVYGANPKGAKADGSGKDTKAGGGGKDTKAGGGGKQSGGGGKKLTSKGKGAKSTEAKETGTGGGDSPAKPAAEKGKANWPRAATPARVRDDKGNSHDDKCYACGKYGHYERELVCEEARIKRGVTDGDT